MQEGLKLALQVTSKSARGVPWSIPREWAEELIREQNLNLQCRNGDISGEASALFQFNGQTLRLRRHWTGRYELYHGDWKSDPHWTGD